MPNAHPDQRPDPDALLARVREEETRGQRGRLRIFFGAAPGVGKSYAMLEAARKLKADGVDVIVGYVELHGRPDTEALLAGLEILPPQRLEHRGIVLTEFDLDAALQRRPHTILVDELAHSNHPGARHPKRWKDVEELLGAGIDVYTTVNVQHLESLNDVVTQITGVQVRETVPDNVFDSADEIELVDLPPDELLQRLHEGKVYVEDKIKHALESFFRKGNLIALRQLALRATADRVDDSMREYRERHAIGATWPAGERVLVCVGPDPLSARLVRSARRLAAALHADWLAVYVETPSLVRLSKQARDRVLQTLKLAESLGAETANLSGESVAAELLAFARQRNVSKIICGKPSRSGWRSRVSPSLVDEIIRHSGDIDVYVITGEEGAEVTGPPRMPTRSSKWQAYAKGIAVVVAITLACFVLNEYIERTNLVMLYLLGTVLVAIRFGRGPSVVASVLSVSLFDFLFVPPVYSFAVSDAQYLITFAVMLATGLIISNLAARGRRQASVARQRERRSGELYALSRELAQNRDLGELGAILCRHALAIFDGEAAVLLPDSEGRLLDPANFCARGGASASLTRYPVPGNDLGIAQWAYDHRQKAGRNTDTLGQRRRDLPAAQRAQALHRRARPAPEGSAPARDPRADASARIVRDPGRRRDGTRATGAGRTRRGHTDRIGETAQYPAVVDLARFPHAAGEHHRRGSTLLDRASAALDEERRRTLLARGARRGAAPAPAGRQPARPHATHFGTGAAQAPAGRDRRACRRRAASVARRAGRQRGLARPAGRPAARAMRRSHDRASTFQPCGKCAKAYARRERRSGSARAPGRP